jgi:hypothetical protein
MEQIILFQTNLLPAYFAGSAKSGRFANLVGNL